MTRGSHFLPIGEVADIRQGKYLSKLDMQENKGPEHPIPVHGASGTIGWTATSMYRDGVALVTCRGSNSGMVLWADGPLWVSNNAMAIVPKNGRNKFAYYSLLSSPPYETVSGSAQPQITRSALISRRIYWPEPYEQDAVSYILGSLDSKIELNRRMNETLEAMAQAVFRDWFVEFGPTRRKLEGATDPVTIMGGLVSDPTRAQELADLFPAALGDDGLPEGWRVAPLEQTLVLQRGFDLPKSTRGEGEYPVIAASGHNGTHSEFKVKAPGVCTGRSGVLGNVFYIQEDFWPLNTSLWVKSYPNATPVRRQH